jgi:uncharacterized protein (DUF427 family)
MADPTTKSASARLEASQKRVRVVINGKTIADSVRPVLLFESGSRPVWYFPRADLRADLIEKSGHESATPARGPATYWTLTAGNRRVENALWSHERPPAGLEALKDYFAFAPDKVDHWFEEDEEAFGHARDPYHRIDVRPSTRRVRVVYAGETIADTTRAMFLFETGLPTRYYVPAADVRTEFLAPTARRTTCPYKGHASYWTIRVGDRVAENAVWGYLDPQDECLRVKGLLCFYPEKVEAIDVEGGPAD